MYSSEGLEKEVSPILRETRALWKSSNNMLHLQSRANDKDCEELIFNETCAHSSKNAVSLGFVYQLRFFHHDAPLIRPSSSLICVERLFLVTLTVKLKLEKFRIICSAPNRLCWWDVCLCDFRHGQPSSLICPCINLTMLIYIIYTRGSLIYSAGLNGKRCAFAKSSWSAGAWLL